MGTYLQLSTDPKLNNNWSDRRLAVGAALFIAYLIHFIFIGITYLLQHKVQFCKIQANLIQRKMYLFGVACLFSINYVQGGAGVAVYSWLTLPIILVLHFTVPGWISSEKVKNVLWAIYYFQIFIWFFIVTGDFYSTNNDRTNSEIKSE